MFSMQNPLCCSFTILSATSLLPPPPPPLKAFPIPLPPSSQAWKKESKHYWHSEHPVLNSRHKRVLLRIIISYFYSSHLKSPCPPQYTFQIDTAYLCVLLCTLFAWFCNSDVIPIWAIFHNPLGVSPNVGVEKSYE